MIVCLGWGSLVWEPRTLPITDDGWHEDGPSLPVEFLRQSQDGRLTLVIDVEASPQAVLWATMRSTSLSDAVDALQCREGTPTDRPIGRWPSTKPYPFSDDIAAWAQQRAIKGVVWTALGPKFRETNGLRPGIADATAYLGGLSGETRDLAEEYVRRAPRQIVTPYRQAFERELGWTCTDGA